MPRVRVPVYGRPTGYTVVDTDATAGAVIGTNLFNADGTLFDLAAVQSSTEQANSAGVGQQPVGETVAR